MLTGLVNISNNDVQEGHVKAPVILPFFAFSDTMQKHTPLQPLSRNRKKNSSTSHGSHKHYTNPSKKKTKFTQV